MLDRSRSRDRSKTGGAFSPAGLFVTGAQGAWYDPSDFSTLFQDSAGSTPVTAVEQPVGLMLDRSGRGNHASQATSDNKPILRSRYNLLTYSEEFDNGAWTKSSVTVTANTDTAPDGTLTADTLEATGANGTALGSLVLVAGSYTFSVYLRRKTGTGDVDISAHSGGTWVTQTITSSWARYTVTQTLTAGTRTPGIRIVTSGDEVYARGAQLLSAADQAATGGAYQRVGAATDYDVSNPVWRPYLAFDGVDDVSSTANIDFSATDKMTVFVGAHNLTNPVSGSEVRFIMELSVDFDNNNGTVSMTMPRFITDNSVNFASRGTLITSANFDSLPPPVTAVLTGLGDISGDSTTLRVNGAQVAQNTGDQGTGNYGNYPLFIGGRGSYRFLGRLYSLAVLGRTATAAELSAMEAWVAGKTGVVL